MSKRRRRGKQVAPPIKIADAPVDPPEPPGGPAAVVPTDLGQAPRGFDRHGARITGQTRPEAEAQALVGVPPVIDLPRLAEPSEVHVITQVPASVAPPQEEPESTLPNLLPARLTKWLDRATTGPLGDLQNALIAAGWSIQPPVGDAPVKAFPPGASMAGSPFVPLPDTLDGDRALANLVYALRRIGDFEWEG